LERTGQTLKQVRSSARYQLGSTLGSAVAKTATHPKRAGSAALGLARLARREIVEKRQSRVASWRTGPNRRGRIVAIVAGDLDAGQLV